MVIIAILLAIGFVTKYSVDFSRRVVLTWAVMTPAVLILVTVTLHELMRRLLYDPSMVRRVAFAGCNEVSLSLAQRIGGGSLGMQVEGFFDDRSAERLGLAVPARLLGTLPDVVSFVKRNQIDVVFVALPVSHIRRVVQLLDELRDTTASVYYVPDIFAIDLIQARSGELFGIPVVALCETPFYGYRGVVKRVIDIALALTVLVVALPLVNVLQGHMSLVGPRPHAVAHNEEYRKLIKGYMIRHKVPPGITGLAQVNGCRGETARVEDMQARIDYDLEYLRHWSPLLDFKILFLTAVRLLRDEKAY
jgi:putative colanic acid biosynthesis UDP-glucose lipid carrier transferase